MFVQFTLLSVCSTKSVNRELLSFTPSIFSSNQIVVRISKKCRCVNVQLSNHLHGPLSQSYVFSFLGQSYSFILWANHRLLIFQPIKLFSSFLQSTAFNFSANHHRSTIHPVKTHHLQSLRIELNELQKFDNFCLLCNSMQGCCRSSQNGFKPCMIRVFVISDSTNRFPSL